MDLTKEIDEAVAEASTRVKNIKEHLTNRFTNKTGKFTTNDNKTVTDNLDAIMSAVAALGGLVARSGLNDVSKLLDGLVEKMKTPVKPTKSYADAAGRGAVASSFAPETQSIEAAERAIILSNTTSNPIETLLQKVNVGVRGLRARGNHAKIKRIIKGKTAVIVKIPQTEDIDQLIAEFKKIDELNASARIYPAQRQDPSVMFTGVVKYVRKEEFINSLCSMNAELHGEEDQFELLFEMKSDTDLRNIVARVTPSMYRKLMDLRRVWVMNQQVRVYKKTFVTQCQRCFCFTHKTKNCLNQPKCATCGVHKQGHTCSKITKCMNCSQHPKYKHGNVVHFPNCAECPLYELQIKRSEQNTNYHGEESTLTVRPPRHSSQDDTAMDDSSGISSNKRLRAGSQ